jgi:PAS domain S-box-containing protein
MKISKRFIHALFMSPVWWIGVATSCALFFAVMQMVEDKNRAQFEYSIDNAQLVLQHHIRTYIDVLRGATALFYTSDKLTRAQFHAYVQKLELERRFPGIANLNFAQHFSAADKKAFEASVRSDTSLDKYGYPDFTIKPPGERAEYHVLTYLEPLETSLTSFGIDIAANAVGANSLAVSRDNGQLFSSGRLIRITGPHRHIGVAIRMPLYRRGMPTNTVAERRSAYIGSVGAGFDVKKLILGAIEKNIPTAMRIRLYDTGRSDEPRKAGTTDPDNLLFDSAAVTDTPPTASMAMPSSAQFVKRVSMTVGQRIWEIEFAADRSTLVHGFDAYLPWLVLIGGLIGSILLYSIYYSMMTARRRAMELARTMTKGLRNSEASLAEAQHMARLGSWVLEPGNGQMSWSAQTFRIFGMEFNVEELLYHDFLLRIHADDRQRLSEGLDRTLFSGEEFSMEHRIIQCDGTLRWVQTMSRLGRAGLEPLLRGTIMDITERKNAVETLKRSQELLRDLTSYQDRVKEDERKRIAREIHDELGQTLLVLRIDVAMLEARTGPSHPRLNEKVRSALSYIDATVNTVRTIINNLRPAVLDLGLTAAIEWQVTEFRRRTGIACDLVMHGKEFALDDATATSLFRILQESLTNVIRHAKATQVVIKLYEEDQRRVMKISDNGIGISPDSRKANHSFGLVGIEERIHALNGEFRILSAPGKGTTLAIYIPLQSESNEPNSLNPADSST